MYSYIILYDSDVYVLRSTLITCLEGNTNLTCKGQLTFKIAWHFVAKPMAQLGNVLHHLFIKSGGLQLLL